MSRCGRLATSPQWRGPARKTEGRLTLWRTLGARRNCHAWWRRLVLAMKWAQPRRSIMTPQATLVCCAPAVARGCCGSVRGSSAAGCGIALQVVTLGASFMLMRAHGTPRAPRTLLRRDTERYRQRGRDTTVGDAEGCRSELTCCGAWWRSQMHCSGFWLVLMDSEGGMPPRRAHGRQLTFRLRPARQPPRPRGAAQARGWGPPHQRWAP